MSVIIRLQGLSWSASTVDIRGLFVGLSIPQGGVHIIGGTQGLAFIAFASDDDARQAMMRNGATLCSNPVQLFLSSKTEMQAIISEARGADPPAARVPPVPPPAATPFTPRGQQAGGVQAGDAAIGGMRQGGPQGLKGADRLPPEMQTQPDPRKPPPAEGQRYPSPAASYGQGPAPTRGQQHQAHTPWKEGAEDQMGRQGGRVSRFGDYPPRQGPGPFPNELTEHDTHGPNQRGSFTQAGPQKFGDQQEQFASRGGMPGGQDRNRGGLLPMPDTPSRGDQGGTNQQRNAPGPHFDNTEAAGFYPEREEEVHTRGTAWEGYQGGRGRPPVPAVGRHGSEDDTRAVGQGQPQGSERDWAYGRGGVQSHRAPASDIDKRQGRGRRGDEEDLDFRNAAQSRKRPWPADGMHDERNQGHDLQAADGNQDWRPVRRRYEDRPMETDADNRARDRSLDRQGAMDSRSNRPHAGNSRMSGSARYGEKDFDSRAGPDIGHSEAPHDDRSAFRGPGGRPPFSGKEHDRMAEREYKSQRVHDRDRERPVAERDLDARHPHGAPTNSGPDWRSLERDPDGRSRRGSPGSMPPNRDSDRRELNSRGSFDRGLEGRRKEMWHDRYQQGSADGQEFEGPFEDTEPSKRFDRPRHSRFGPQEDEEFREPHGSQLSDRGRFEGRGRGRGQRGGRGFPGERRGGSWRGKHREAAHEHGKEFPPYDHPEGDAYPPSDEMGPANQEFEGEGHFRGQWSDRRDHDGSRGRGRGWRGMERGRGDWERGGRRGRSQGRFMDSGEEDSWNADERPPRHGHPPEGNGEWKNSPDAPQQGRPVKKGLLGDAPPGVHRNRPHLNESTEPPLYIEDDLQTERHFSHPRGRGRGRGAFSDRYGEQDRGRERSSLLDGPPDRTHGPNRWGRDRSREKDPDQPSTSKYKWRAQSQTGKADTEKTTGNMDKSVAQKTGSFVQVKGIPVSYGETEIRNFFFGCEIEGNLIHSLKNAQGQPTGEVNIKFVNEENAKRAVGKNGEKVFGKPVTVTFTTGKTFEGQPESHLTSSSRDEEKGTKSDDLIVMIKGFPPNIKLEDVRNLFAIVKLVDKETAALIERDGQQKATGVAYLEVASQQDFDKAMGFNGQVFGEGILQVMTGKRQDLDACIKRQEGMFQNSTITVVEKLSAQAVQPSGLGLGVMGARPPLMGQAPAKSLPQPLLSLSFTQPKPDTDSGNSHGDQSSEDLPCGEHPADFCVHVKGLPTHVSYFEIRDFFSGLSVVYNRGVQIVHDGGGNRIGEAFVQFTSQQDKDEALKLDGMSMGRHTVAVTPVSKSEMIARLKDARMMGQVPFDDDIGPVKTFRPGLLNPEWCYLSCTNFPRTFAEPDFLNFFADFGPIPESLRLHRSPEGVPTGKALVGFPHREDAVGALRELHGMQVGPFTVALQAAM